MTWNTQDEKNYIEMMISRFEIEGKSPLPFLKNYPKQQSIWEYSDNHPVENCVDIEELKNFVKQKINKYQEVNQMTYDHNYCPCCHKSPCECNIPELLPCPFCNGNNIGVWDEGFNVYQVGCEDCDIQGPHADSKIEAAKRWNNRPGRDRLLTKIKHLDFEKDRLYDRAMKAEEMLFDQYSGRLSQEDVFTYIRDQLEKI